jgi:hypothetical protein
MVIIAQILIEDSYVTGFRGWREERGGGNVNSWQISEFWTSDISS